jgi:hypothetical protein
MFCGDCGTRVDPRPVSSVAPPAPSSPGPASPSGWAPPPLLAQTDAPAHVITGPPTTVQLPARPRVEQTPTRSPFAPLTVSVSTPEAEDDDLDATIIAPRKPAWLLLTPDGARHTIRATTIIGRNPRRPVTHPDAELLGLVDSTRSLSKSHAVLEPTVAGLVITDLGSTNGVIVIGADGSETDVPSGRPTTLEQGMRLELGEFVIVIEKP